MTSVQILVDNNLLQPQQAEHGLSLYIRYGNARILFDTGAGNALAHNLELAGLQTADFTHLVISHGHYDHTGALAAVLQDFRGQICYVPGCTAPHWSLHRNMPPRNISMTAENQTALLNYPQKKAITGFTEIAPGIWLTGPIPRISGEDCGGPFFQDQEGKIPDTIADEQAMLLSDGTLIQGCCHAGIINTIRYCQKCAPEIPVRHVIGGLHLLHASPERLRETADFLQNCRITPLHCTGETAIPFLHPQTKKDL